MAVGQVRAVDLSKAYKLRRLLGRDRRRANNAIEKYINSGINSTDFRRVLWHFMKPVGRLLST